MPKYFIVCPVVFVLKAYRLGLISCIMRIDSREDMQPVKLAHNITLCNPSSMHIQ